MTVSILSVDDEPDVAELFRQHFRREVTQGLYALHFVASAEEALQMLADGIRPRPIVILSDINMPGMDGLSLLREVKKVRPEISVMMVTAYGDDERRRRATIAKPLRPARFGIGEVRGAEHGDKNLRRPGLATEPIDDHRHRIAGVIDKQLVAAGIGLSHRHRQS